MIELITVVYDELVKLFENPVIKLYTIEQIKAGAFCRRLCNTDSLFIGDFITYIHAPQVASMAYKTLMMKYGAKPIELALKRWMDENEGEFISEKWL